MSNNEKSERQFESLIQIYLSVIATVVAITSGLILFAMNDLKSGFEKQQGEITSLKMTSIVTTDRQAALKNLCERYIKENNIRSGAIEQKNESQDRKLSNHEYRIGALEGK